MDIENCCFIYIENLSRYFIIVCQAIYLFDFSSCSSSTGILFSTRIWIFHPSTGSRGLRGEKWPSSQSLRGRAKSVCSGVRRRRDTKTDHRKGGSEKQWIRRNVWRPGGGRGPSQNRHKKTGHSETDSLRSRNYTVRHGEEKDGLESASNIE